MIMTDSISKDQAHTMLRWLNQNREKVLSLYKNHHYSIQILPIQSLNNYY